MSRLPECADCASFNTRRAARLIGQVYDQALERAGVTGTQFSLLAALMATGPLSIGDLARQLGVDRTTLTRSLRLLVHRKLVRITPGRDARLREVSTTPQGCVLFSKSLPAWQATQRALVGRFGVRRWQALKMELRALEDSAVELAALND